MHYDMDSLDWIDLGGTGWKRASVTLDEGETADNPGSTKRPIYGPAVVRYDVAPDGGINAYVEDVPA